MSDDTLFIDQNNLVGYIRTALSLDGISVTPELIAHILDLELEYLQHHGIAEEVVDDPRPE
jgi:hypothetical protein